MFNKISTHLISVITASSKIQSMYQYEASDLQGSPALTLTPSANESDYHSTTENTRVYAFLCRLYTIRKSGNDEEGITESAMRELVDLVLNNLDHNHQLPGLQSQTGYTFLFMEAVPSSWGYAGRENMYRVAEIIIRVHFSVDVNLIS